jgi:small conductance mechanosensitive channel
VVFLSSVGDILRQIADLLRLDAREFGRKLFQLGFVWLAAFVAWRLVLAVARRIIAAADDGDDSTFTEAEQRSHTVANLLKSVGRTVIIAVALLLTLNAFLDIGPLLAGAGILGLAVSFGAQSLVKDVIAGFFILSENQFGIGDVIEVAGKSGAVERMSIRVVMLRDTEGVLHVIPNGQITTVSNRTRKWARAVVDVSVSYQANVDVALGVLRDELAQFAADPLWALRLDGAPEVLGVQDLGESAVIIRTLTRTQAGAQWEVGRELRRRLKIRLDNEGLEIPPPQMTVQLRGADPRARPVVPPPGPGAGGA